MDKRQLEIMQHTLGLDQYGQPKAKSGESHRNHFVAGEADAGVCRELVQQGLMVERNASDLTGGAPLFQVTEEGQKAIAENSPSKPKLTRSQERYREYARFDCNLSFGDYLKAGLGK